MLIWQTANLRKVLEGKRGHQQQPVVVAPCIIHGSKNTLKTIFFYVSNICRWNTKHLILNYHDAKSFLLWFFFFFYLDVRKQENVILHISFWFLKGLNPFWLGWRRITLASSCRPLTTSSTTHLRCSSTPTLPMGTTGDCGACTSSPRRSGWTRAMRRPLSGEGPGCWAASIIDEHLWWNMDRPEVWLIHVWNHQAQLL